MTYTFVMVPFTAPRNKSYHFSKKIHVPKVVFLRECHFCGKVFETLKSRQVFCCRKHKAIATAPKYCKVLEAKVRLASEEFLELERANPDLAHYHFPKSRNQLGTFSESTNLKVVMVDGKERIYGAVWLQRQIQRGRVNYGNKTRFEAWTD